MNVKTNFITILILILAISCQNNVEEVVVCVDEISYTQTIRAIIDNNCMQCHDGSDNLPNFDTYEVLSNNAQKVQELTTNRFMPKEGNLTNAEIEAIFCWVEQGALNN